MKRINTEKIVVTIVAVFCIIINGNSQKIIQTKENTTNKTVIPTYIKALISTTLEQRAALTPTPKLSILMPAMLWPCPAYWPSSPAKI
jgi:hypothetical protein